MIRLNASKNPLGAPNCQPRGVDNKIVANKCHSCSKVKARNRFRRMPNGMSAVNCKTCEKKAK